MSLGGCPALSVRRLSSWLISNSLCDGVQIPLTHAVMVGVQTAFGGLVPRGNRIVSRFRFYFCNRYGLRTAVARRGHPVERQPPNLIYMSILFRFAVSVRC